MIGFLIRVLFFGSFLAGPVFTAVMIGIMVHLYRKSDKYHREHPEKYRNRKEDNFCYWDGE